MKVKGAWIESIIQVWKVKAQGEGRDGEGVGEREETHGERSGTGKESKANCSPLGCQ